MTGMMQFIDGQWKPLEERQMETTLKIMNAALAIEKMSGILTMKTVMMEGGTVTEGIYIITHATMGAIEPLAWALSPKSADIKSVLSVLSQEEGSKFGSGIDRDMVLFASLYVAMNEDSTKEGKEIMAVTENVMRQIDEAHAAFKKIRGYDYVSIFSKELLKEDAG